jgi:group I intron endonuclease
MMMVGSIYLITIKRGRGCQSKFYIGQAVTFWRRKSSHLTKLRAGKHKNPALQAAWLKYGESAFSFSVLEKCELRDLADVERRWFDVFVEKYGVRRMFNMRRFYGSSIWIDPEFARERSAIRRAQWAQPEFREKMKRINKEVQNRPEIRAQNSARQLIIQGNPEMRERQRIAQLVAQNRPETKARKSIGMRLALADPEDKARRAATNARPEVKLRRSIAASERQLRIALERAVTLCL